MGCFYYKKENGELIRYDLESSVYEDFLKETSILASNSIFSSEDVVDSVKREILKANSPKAYYEATDIETVYEFVTKPHAEIFGNIAALKGQSRLAPEFIQENRILEFVKAHLEEYTNNTGAVYTPEYLEMLKRDPVLKQYDDKDLIPALAEVESRIRIEEMTKNFSIKFHEWVDMILSNNGKFEEDFRKFYSENPEIFGNDVDISIWEERIKSIIGNIIRSLEGEPLRSIHLVSLPNKANNVQLKAKLGIVTVNTSGVASIYDVKISKHPFSDWDESKTLTYDWELALERQLLGQHIDVENTRLYIIPIEFGKLGDITTLKFGTPINRTTQGVSGLEKYRQISSIAEILLPRKIKPEYDPNKIAALKDSLNKLLFPDYRVKTEWEDNDLELLMKNSRERFEKTGVFKKYNGFKDIDGLPEGMIIETTEHQTAEEAETKFREKMALYVNHVKSLEGRGVSVVKNAVISSIATGSSIKLGKNPSKKDIALDHVLTEYLNDDWQVLEGINEADALGIIVMRNTKTGIINLFDITVHNLWAESGIKGMTYDQVEMLKAMYFLNEYKDVLLAKGAYKLGEIIVFNSRNGKSRYRSSATVLTWFRRRMNEVGMGDKIKINDNDLVGTEDLALMTLNTYVKNYAGKGQKEVENIFSILQNNRFDEISRERLIEARDQFLIAFPEYRDVEPTKELDFQNPTEVLYALLQTAILSKSGIKPEVDFQGLTEYSIEAGDFQSLWLGILNKNQRKYDKKGNRILGIIGGLSWINPEFVQSKDLRNINEMVANGNSINGQKLNKFSEHQWPLTDELYRKLGYGKFKQMTWGETQSIHADFFVKDKETGKIDKSFRAKNPYIIDEENALTEDQRKYLKQTLLYINGFMAGLPENEIYSIDPTNLENITNNKWLKARIESGDYFKMPLMRREEISKYKRLVTGFGEWYNMVKDNLRDTIDPREFSSLDVENIEHQKLGFFQMYDVFGSQDDETRARMMDREQIDYFELNLDTIAHKVAFYKTRKRIFDIILPTIESYVWWMKLMGGKMDEKVRKQLNYIVNQVNLAVFSKPLVDDEEKNIAQGLAFQKKFSTIAMLAFRPTMLVKEITVGTIRNLLTAGTGIHADFGEKEMIKAYEKLLTVGLKQAVEHNLIEALNNEYRIANMDIATMPEKVQHDKLGLARGLGRWMFATSTGGDYFNRLAILLARMIKDGSYEAHSMKGNTLVYDPRKDKRFSYYLAEREKYKDADGNYTKKSGDSLYNEQRNLYLLMIEQFNSEYAIVGEGHLTEKDLIPKAYTLKERNSIKAMADRVYGAYDKDAQAQINNKLAGIAFFQFMQYWPSKMQFWFGKPISADASPVGKFEHAVKKDADGNLILDDKGKPIHLYLKDVVDENGDPVLDEYGVPKREIVEYETDEKLMAWNGTPQEGIFYSVFYTINDLVRLNWDDLKKNKWRVNRTLYAIGDSVLIFMILGIMRAIYDSMKDSTERGTFSGETVAFMDAVNTKVLNEYNLWNNTFGALSSEPAWLSWSLGAMQNVGDVIQGDKTLGKAAAQSIGMFEMLR